MGKRPNDPASGCFRVLVGTRHVGDFQELVLPATQVTEIEYNYGESLKPIKRPGQGVAGPVELRYGAGCDDFIRVWHADIQADKFERRSMSFIELDEERREVKRWLARGCWPRELEYSDLDGQLMRVEIVCDTIRVA